MFPPPPEDGGLHAATAMSAPEQLDPDLDLHSPEAREHYRLLREVAKEAWKVWTADPQNPKLAALRAVSVEARRHEVKTKVHPMTRSGR